MAEEYTGHLMERHDN